MKKIFFILLVLMILSMPMPSFAAQSGHRNETDLREQQYAIDRYYKSFLLEGAYKSAMDSGDGEWYGEPEKYTTLDIDENGIPELIMISGHDGLGFCNFLVFSYDDTTGKIECIDHGPYTACGDLEYSKKYQALAFRSIRASVGIAYIDYYVLQNNHLEPILTVVNEVKEDNSISHYLYQDDSQPIEITEEEYSEGLYPVEFAFNISDIDSLKNSTDDLKDEAKVNVSVNHVPLQFTSDLGVPFVDSSNRTQVPLRLTMEACGLEVGWNQNTKVATVTDGITIVEIPIGQPYIFKNGERVENDTEAVVLNGRTYLPIRVVLEAFGAEVSWDQKSRTVIVVF